jgi:hypothetical protein
VVIGDLDESPHNHHDQLPERNRPAVPESPCRSLRIEGGPRTNPERTEPAKTDAVRRGSQTERRGHRTDSLVPVAYRFSRSLHVSSPRYLFSPTRTHYLVARGRQYLFSRSLVHGRPYFLTSHHNYCDSAHCGPDSRPSSTSYPFSHTPEGIGTDSLTPTYRFSRTCVPFLSHPVPILSHPRTYSLTPLIG